MAYLGASGKEHGGVGFFLRMEGEKSFFGVKFVRLLKEDGEINSGFWQEARSVFSYGSGLRFTYRTAKIACPSTYWIHENDKFYKNNVLLWQNQSSEFPQNLAEFLEGRRIGAVDIANFRKYKRISRDLLRKIYHEKLPADLLLAYFIAAGEKNLEQDTSIIRNMNNNPKEVLRMASHVLEAILILHEHGRAHCDIKPANIAVWQYNVTSGHEKIPLVPEYYRLIDFGSLGSSKQPSGSGTPAFFNHAKYSKLKARGLSELDCRTLMDGYALALTIYTIARGGNKPATTLINPDVVRFALGEAVYVIFRALYDVEKLTLPKLHELWETIQDTDVQDDAWEPLKLPSAEGNNNLFETFLHGSNGIDYGRFHEYLRFTDEFDPLMKVGVKSEAPYNWPGSLKPLVVLNNTSGGRAQRCVWVDHCDTGPGMSGWRMIHYYHAPDDVRTGKRPVSFDGYVPYTLANVRPSDSEKASLLAIADECDRLNAAGEEKLCRLPSAHEIVRVDGEWKILWGKCRLVQNNEKPCYRQLFEQLIASAGEEPYM